MTLEKAPASLKTIVDDAIRDIGKAPRKEMKEALDEMTEDLKTSAENFSKAATTVETKAKAADKTMDALAQEAFDLGASIEGLEPIARTYRFISEGKGEPYDVVPPAVDFMKQLLSWEESHFPNAKTIWLRSAIEETDRNWKNSRRV
jgi:Sec-independent protein translocase protein TatA